LLVLLFVSFYSPPPILHFSSSISSKIFSKILTFALTHFRGGDLAQNGANRGNWAIQQKVGVTHAFPISKKAIHNSPLAPPLFPSLVILLLDYCTQLCVTHFLLLLFFQLCSIISCLDGGPTHFCRIHMEALFKNSIPKKNKKPPFPALGKTVCGWGQATP
jgi:hypothetical protein